jgi:hypothetical protein
VTTDDANAIQNSIVDAKGDIVAASANDTPARLAVGNNGETLVADSSTSTGLRYNPQNALANPVINGGMDIWQRGTSVSVAASLSSVYTADRWALNTNANQATTVSRQSVSDSTNLPNIQYCARVQRNASQTGTSQLFFGSNFEIANSVPLAGKTITFSFYARAGANYSPSSSALNIYLFTGTGSSEHNRLNSGPYTGEATPINNQTVTLTTTWQRFAISVTLGTAVTQMCPAFAPVPVGTAGAADYFEVTGIQIDLGTYTASTAPTFRRSGGTIQGELAACQRYYFRTKVAAAYGYIGNIGNATATSTARTTISLPVPMRVQPTAIDYGGAITVSDGATLTTPGSITLETNGTTQAPQVVGNMSTNILTQFRSYMFQDNNAGTAYLGLSAEL